MTLTELIKNGLVYFDGGTGTSLQAMGLLPGEQPERWNFTHPDSIINLHKAYIDAGANIIKTNTFGANPLKFKTADEYNYVNIIEKAIENAKTAVERSDKDKNVFIAFDMGPSGRLLKPFGDLDFDAAVELYAQQVRVAVKYGVDLILVETMSDSYETKAAVIACKENSDLPIFVTNAYEKSQRLMTGADPETMIAMLEGLGVDAIGVNCSVGPDLLKDIIKIYSKYSSLPVIANPNAGLPSVVDGKTTFSFSADEFCSSMLELVEYGARIIGGCCGTTPEYIKKLTDITKDIKPKEITEKTYTVASSSSRTVIIGDKPVLIGEKINPTGNEKLTKALIDNDIDYIISEAIDQQDKGVDMLDVNVGLPEIDEAKTLCDTIVELQTITNLPLQIDTANAQAMEKAMRIYNGKPVVNSVNGTKESMDKIFPLIKKYGGVVIALTLDEKGIPCTADGRIAVAEKIINTAKEYGIAKKNIIIDTLVTTIGTDTKSAVVTLEALNKIRNEYDINTLLGISNISFGMPGRDFLNSTFFTLALANGLSAAIINPYSDDILKAYYSYMVLTDKDEDCESFIDFASML